MLKKRGESEFANSVTKIQNLFTDFQLSWKFIVNIKDSRRIGWNKNRKIEVIDQANSVKFIRNL